jgi:hypothetical protein
LDPSSRKFRCGLGSMVQEGSGIWVPGGEREASCPLPAVLGGGVRMPGPGTVRAVCPGGFGESRWRKRCLAGVEWSRSGIPRASWPVTGKPGAAEDVGSRQGSRERRGTTEPKESSVSGTLSCGEVVCKARDPARCRRQPVPRSRGARQSAGGRPCPGTTLDSSRGTCGVRKKACFGERNSVATVFRPFGSGRSKPQAVPQGDRGACGRSRREACRSLSRS